MPGPYSGMPIHAEQCPICGMWCQDGTTHQESDGRWIKASSIPLLRIEQRLKNIEKHLGMEETNGRTAAE